MNKIKLIILFLGCTALLQAQERTQSLGDFNEIKIFNGLSVDIERSNQAKIEISGEKTDDVTVKNVNGKLKLSLKFPDNFNPDKVKIKVFYNQDLTVLDANEGSAIFSNETIEQDNITIKTQEGAYIHALVNVKYLTIKAVTGASIKVKGTAINQEVEVNTGGTYEAYDLITENADIVSASGGKVEVNVTNLLDAKVRFGGNIYYKGNPEKVNSKKVMGGTIKNKGH
ncbi:MAG: DUF2807 domain-containing protein [Flavobacteriaceae bacterium]|nr:DUF2807 domain-containing protein [Flavobacteriaceae bacterium]